MPIIIISYNVSGLNRPSFLPLPNHEQLAEYKLYRQTLYAFNVDLSGNEVQTFGYPGDPFISNGLCTFIANMIIICGFCWERRGSFERYNLSRSHASFELKLYFSLSYIIILNYKQRYIINVLLFILYQFCFIRLYYWFFQKLTTISHYLRPKCRCHDFRVMA